MPLLQLLHAIYSRQERDPITGRFISDARASVLELRKLNDGLSDLNQHLRDVDNSVPTESFSNFNEQLAIRSQDFNKWSAHPETGSSEHGGG